MATRNTGGPAVYSICHSNLIAYPPPSPPRLKIPTPVLFARPTFVTSPCISPRFSSPSRLSPVPLLRRTRSRSLHRRLSSSAPRTRSPSRAALLPSTSGSPSLVRLVTSSRHYPRRRAARSFGNVTLPRAKRSPSSLSTRRVTRLPRASLTRSLQTATAAGE